MLCCIMESGWQHQQWCNICSATNRTGCEPTQHYRKQSLLAIITQNHSGSQSGAFYYRLQPIRMLVVIARPLHHSQWEVLSKALRVMLTTFLWVSCRLIYHFIINLHNEFSNAAYCKFWRTLLNVYFQLFSVYFGSEIRNVLNDDTPNAFASVLQ